MTRQNIFFISATTASSTTRTSRHRHRRFARYAGLLLILLAALAQSIWAQEDSESCRYCKPKVWVAFNGSICSTSYNRIFFNGQLKHQSNGICNGTFTQVPDVMVGLTVDQTYPLQVIGAASVHLNFSEVPDDYYIEIDGKDTRTIDKEGSFNTAGDGTWNVTLRRKCDCGSDNAGESKGPKQGSVMWDVGLGQLSDGRSAGSISLHSAVLDANIYTPFDLIYSAPGFTTDVDVVLNPDKSLRQVKVPQTLADVVVIDSSQYEVRFYRQADVGAKQNGIYPVSNQPFVVWRIRNPHLGFTDQLEIAKIQNGITDASLYTWASATDNWSLTTGNGARVETKTKTTDPVTGDWTETFIVTNGTGQVISKVARTYHQFPWHEELIAETVDPDNSALTTAYTYYQVSSETGRYRKVKSITMPDGSWEQYDYDSVGNQVLILRPWKDQPLASASEATSYAIRKTYSNYDGITVALQARLVSSIIEKIAGATIRKTTFSRTGTTVNGEPATIETETRYASASLSQATITTRFHSTASTFLANRIVSIQYPDGRKDAYTYEKGDYVTNADPSLNQFNPNANGLSERETVVHGTVSSAAGVAFKSTKDVIVRDQFGHSALQETYVYTGSSYARTTWSVRDYDDRGHVTQTRNSNGSIMTAVWNGDLLTSEIDENGVETTYTYDTLNRLVSRTKKGVATNGSFPAQADIVTTYTTDTEGRVTQETTTGSGGLSVTTGMAFDVAGRLKTETSPDGLTTTHLYTNGGRTETVLLPGGTTKITDKFLDGQIKSVLGTGVLTTAFDYGVNADGTSFAQEFVGSAGTSSLRWTKTSSDWLARVVKIEKPSFVAGSNLLKASTFNSSGQLQSESVMVGTTKLQADKLYEYDSLGNRTRTGSDINGSGTLTLASTDRITDTDEVFQQNGSDWWRVTTTTTYLVNNSSTATTTAIESERLTNFAVNGSENTISEVVSTDEGGNQTRSTTTVDRGAKIVTARTDLPDSATDGTEVRFNGLVESTTAANSGLVQTYSYDALGRPLTVSDPVSGTRSKAYSPSTDQLVSESHGTQTTSYDYYPSSHPSAGRLKVKTDANGKKTYFNYSGRGELVQTWGDSTYPIEYVYDDFGQKTEMHTFRDGSGWQGTSWPTATTGTMDVTKWIYHQPSGLLATKQDAAGKQVIYTYDVVGRVATRKWARLNGASPLTSTYSYNPNSGELSGITYSDTTEPVTFTSDRGNRISNITDAAGSHTLTYNAAAQLLTDQVTGGLLDSISVSVGYDGFLRRQSLQATRSATTLTSQTYGYDALSRPDTVVSGSQTITYGYDPITTQLNTTTFTGGTTTTRTYDSLGRLQTLVTTTPGSGTVAGYTYTYNDLDQRTRVTREDNSYWSYSYNDRGELISGKKYWSDNSAVAGQQTEYDFDSLGNRTSTKSGGDAQGLNLREATYTANSLNQYQQRTVPGAVSVFGTANAAATVTVNNQATSRLNDYFYKELLVDNTVSPVYAPVNVFAIRTGVGGNGEDAVMQSNSHVYVPKSVETYTYDADGNLTSDGRWNYTRDAENRLRSMQAIAAVPVEARKRLEFTYDYLGRRIQKKVYNWNIGTGTYQLQSTTKFIYDGWDLIAELDGNNNVTRSNVWSNGELLLINAGANSYQVGVDGNTNVGTLIKASSGTVSASYSYDPVGGTMQATGEYASQNPLRFSSKYTDVETGLIYYGYRYHNPQTGRWLSRDSLEEEGGENLYAFLKNDGVNDVDILGQKSFSDYAHEKMWDLYKNRANYVGRYYPYDKQGKEDTDCYTYVYQVLVYAYKKIGRPDVARQLGDYSRHGTSVAKYLISLGWTGNYWNPDVDNPHDGDTKELRGSFYIAKRTGKSWGGTPVTGFIVNFRPSPQGWIMWLRRIPPTTKNYGAFDRLSKVKFAYGITWKDRHTFLYSWGEVFEVHWDRIDDVYGKVPFYTYEWNAGLMITPPDSGFVGDRY